ncbi:hypothetical protein DJ533_16510 [Acinetobacter defluvii]|uniref:Uncharacterized protein n=1 Tax=Acinetobacter defluvii TaxID=1871111 RepID=A0A2S2FGG3_9GAMM|nr:hypothetical protein [Acinetobacter defluvii]AWL30056.1 hypothetical protein DJ533_16510 [Acinetobacter defluvii]
MLDFWYSERCTRQVKLMVSIVLCIAIYYCSSIAKLSPLFVGISLAIGIILHVLKQLSLKTPTQTVQFKLLKAFIMLLPAFALASMVWSLPQQNLLYLILQCLGFIALGFILIANYENRAKRSD